MKTLIIRLAAPLQSYGNEAAFNRRTSYHFPSKSAMVGMIAAALGYRRDDKRIPGLNDLQMAVRIDQPGQTLTDFQIVEYNRKSAKRSLSYRDYLQDAIFVLGVGGEDEEITEVYRALRYPKFQLCFGRRANVPAGPLKMKIFNDQDPVTVLKTCEWQASKWYQRQYKRPIYSAEIIADAKLIPGKRSELVKDKVGSFSQRRRLHIYRSVSVIRVELKNQAYQGTDHDVMGSIGE
ncbi:type I-E CRISPR-associated protein Cas5/CasD [Limosilactobacillus difficilis]|uniref:type I-E CRISPR-associated protein Cas5/CasD n=1 Tax=Limosilactobacillus difficilis TaxID=2991838 RepID=UPI0024BBE892|nr:type I-E CRISPR-associated protein Cas5/CasD [Limosilactobacillus difficilis]